jgi:signal peptidase I
VIGIPGDRVACCTDGKVTVQPEGAGEPVVLQEDYLFEDSAEAFCAAGLGDSVCPVGSEGILVPEGRLWVMGDHRSRSSDSRAHISDANSGTVPQDKVIGRAFVIVWPIDRARLLSAPDTFSAVSALPSAALAGTPYALGLLAAVPVAVLRRRLTRRAARRPAGHAAPRTTGPAARHAAGRGAGGTVGRAAGRLSGRAARRLSGLRLPRR